MQLRKAAFAGFRYQLYLKVFSVILHQVSNITLAILLIPDDFAIVGVAMIFVSFSAAIADFGLGSALIQRRSDSDVALMTGATLRLVLSLILVSILAGLSPLVAELYQQPSLREVIWLLSVLVVLNFAGFVARISLTKSLRFREVFIPEVAGGAASSVSSMAFAFAGWSYWSLVAGALMGAAVTVVLLYVICPWWPRWHIDRRIASELLRFGVPLVTGGVLGFVFMNVGVAFLGVLRFEDVGFYLYGYSWTIAIPLGFQASIDNVMFPVYSAMEGDRQRIRRAYLATVRQVARVVVPGEIFLLVASPTFVVGLVGSKWAESVPIVSILSVAGLLYVISLSYPNAAVSMGHPKESSLFNGLAAAIMIPMAVVMSTWYGAVGLALALLLTCAVLFGWATYRSNEMFGDIYKRTTETLLPPIAASMAFAVPVALLQLVMLPSFESIVLEVSVATGIYLAVMIGATRGGVIRETKEIIASFLNK